MSDKLSILIVDGNRTNLALMDMLVRKLPGAATLLQSDPAVLLDGLGRLQYDLAVIARQLPQIDGIDLARRLRASAHLRDRPLLLTADDADARLRGEAQEAGISAVLLKPIDPVEFRTRILELTRRPPQGPGPGWDDPGSVPELATREADYLSTLVRVAGFRDRESPMHGERMARYCAILAHHLGMPEAFCRDIRQAAPLHDIGKAGLGDALLRKPGFLSPEERREMEEHTVIGHAMLKGARSPVFRMAAEIALGHHERWNGSGYPHRLRGEQIPLPARIAAVADVFDALTNVRAYKTAWSIANAFTYLHDNAGEQFDPVCVAAFESGQEEIADVMRALPDPDDGTADAA